MDELTPMEPEFQEIPPEQPRAIPHYYGTGVQPQQQKSRLPLVLTLLTVLMAANLVTVAVSLFMDKGSAETKAPENDYLLPIDSHDVSNEDLPGKKDFQIDGGLTLKEIYDHYAPGTAVVSAQTEYGFYCATGVVLTQDGYLLTDADFVVKARELYVTLHDGTGCEAVFVGTEANSDMTILKIDREGLTTASLGEDISRRAQQVLERILKEQPHQASLNLDISDVPRPMRIYWGLPEGVIVNRIGTNSNAYRAGMRPGDVILQIGRISVTNTGEYLEALSSYSAGETVRVYLYRNGATYYTDVCLDAQ